MSEMKQVLLRASLVSFACFPEIALSEPASLLQLESYSGRHTLLFESRATSLGSNNRRTAASLFLGRAGEGLFALKSLNEGTPHSLLQNYLSSDQLDGVRDLIGRVEAGSLGFDAVQHGALQLPGKLPTEMTIAEIFSWIEATPGQPHAIGRYQIIPQTLRRLVRQIGIDEKEVFTMNLQNRLVDQLLVEAELPAFITGKISRRAFMYNLAKIWAGLPTPSGRSYYHGYAGNRATMTWPAFRAEMIKIFSS